MSYRDDDDPFEEDIVFDQAGLLTTSRKSPKSAIRRVSSGKCAMLSKTLGLCGAFFGLGLTVALPGPLSPSSPSELRSDLSLMTYEVMYRCQGFMIGAMFGARLLDRFNRLFLVFLALLVTALQVIVIPWCSLVWLLRTDMFLLGVSLGFLTTGGNVLCLDLWGRNSGPFMQALHCSFSLGIFLAPFMFQPLMSSANNAIVSLSTVATTTADGFSLHRLPRDVSNISSTDLKMATNINPIFPPVPHSHLDASLNKSLLVTSNKSSAVPLLSTADPKFVDRIREPTVPTVIKAINVTPSGTMSTSTLRSGLPTSSVTPKVSQGASSIPLLLMYNQSHPSISPPSVSSFATTNASKVNGGIKVDVSTTTHRAPRPKPVLVNSEKLQDKKWENEKFRKPPPEDLVPVSTTMKPLLRQSNKTATAHMVSSTLSPSTSKTNITLSTTPSNIAGATFSLNVSNLSSPFNKAASLVDKPGSVTSRNVTPIMLSSTSPTPVLLVASFQKSSSLNSSLGVTASSSPHPFVTNKNWSISSQSASLSPQMDNKTASETEDGHWGKESHENSDNEKNVNKQMEEHKNFQSAQMSDQYAHTSERAPIMGPHSSWPSGKVEEPVNNSSPSLSNLQLKSMNPINDTHHVEKSVFRDDKGQTAGLSVSKSSNSVLNTSREKQSKILEAVKQPLQILSSSPLPYLQWKQTLPERTSAVNQKSFGGSHVKTMSEAKAVPPHSSEQGVWPAHPHVGLNSKTQESVGNSGMSPAPGLSKNSSYKPENLGNILPTASLKHTHHSKPASTVVNDTEVTHTVIDAFANRLEKYGLSRMELAYITVGMVLLGGSFLFLSFLCVNPRDPKSKTEEEEINCPVPARNSQRGRINSRQSSTLPSRCMRHTLIAMMMMLMMVTSGVQAMYGQLLMVYAIQPPLQLAPSTGSALTATFWGALTSTRVACILLASALSPTSMLVLSVAICSCATWLLSAFASSSEVALWIGSVMVSVGTASVFPSGMLWMQRHVLITHRVAAMLVMGPAMGEMLFPTLAYKMMVSMGPASLIHLPALLSLFGIALWAATWRLARYPRQSLCSHVDESAGYQLANQHDEDDLLDLTMSPIVNGGGLVSRNSIRSNGGTNSGHRLST